MPYSSLCKLSVDCTDSHEPVRATYTNLYRWPESDAEFVKSVIRKRESDDHGVISLSTTTKSMDNKITTNTNIKRRKWANYSTDSPRFVDSYSCRQMYLRSYTFSKKVSAKEKTKRCLLQVKERASLFAFLWKKKTRRRRKRRNRCSIIGKLRKVCCSAFDSIFARVMSCTCTNTIIVRK